MRRGSLASRPWGLLILGLVAGTPAFAAGFGIFEQGTKAMGMAGAFTAQADDPSMLFHNVGGLAFVGEQAVAGGFSYIQGTEANFQGAAPFPGPSARGEQVKLSQILPHAYWVRPISEFWKIGLGFNAPFGLTTEWEDPNTFAGRFLSTKAGLRAVDLNPSIGWKINEQLGLGFGAIVRFSDIELQRGVPAVNPFTQRVAQVGKIALESDFSEGYGWNAGVLYKWNNSFSIGVSYRSKVTVDYDGDGTLTQVSTGNAQFDGLLRTRLPFGTKLPIATSIEFPDMASVGFLFAITPRLAVETDINWTGWSSFDEVVIDFTGGATNSLPDATIPEAWDDANNYRLGVKYTAASGNEWRFGYVYDETPQPEEAVSPLLPDADRNGFTIGWGHQGNRLKTDLALMYLPFDERQRAKSFAGEGPFFGTYNTTAWLLGATLSF
jgi:long-chain fatty acid transport protein